MINGTASLQSGFPLLSWQISGVGELVSTTIIIGVNRYCVNVADYHRYYQKMTIEAVSAKSPLRKRETSTA